MVWILAAAPGDVDHAASVYGAELATVVAVATLAVWVGCRASGRASLAWALALGGVLAQLIDLWPLVWSEVVTVLPQPFAHTIELIRATGLVALGAVARLLRGLASRRVLVVGLGLAATLHSLRGPVALALVGGEIASLEGRPERGHLRQSSGYTCMPCCLAMVLALHGASAIEGEVAMACRTSPYGSDTYRAVRAARELGMAAGVPLCCRYQRGLAVSGLGDLAGPAVLSVRLRGIIGHAILLVGPAEGGRLRVSDPAEAQAHDYTPEEFSARYTWAGDALVFFR